MFFEEFFKQRGENIEPNANSEVMVCCPFPHDKGYDTKASASFNTKRRIFKCFTCTAEDRESGMSETSFIAKVFDTTYENASKLKNLQMGGTSDNLQRLTDLLLGNEIYKTYLNDRGISDEAIQEYKLGYNGEGIVYPVTLEGILFDTRTYVPNPTDGEPKIRSRKNAKPLLFPYDKWINDERPTLLCAGEGDTLLARIKGFNAVETTLGEGSVPKILINKFKGKRVYVVYDCDAAGKKSAHRIAFYLKDVGAEVFIVDLGLTGEKHDKDITDYFIQHKKTAADLQALLDSAQLFTVEEYITQKNSIYPLVDLWDVKESKYSEKYISSRVMQMGHFELPTVDVPAQIEWVCRGAIEGNKACDTCPFSGKSGEWTLGSDNLEDVLKLVEVSEEQKQKAIKRLCRLPDKCPNSSIKVVAKNHVEKVILAPDVETEHEASGFKQAELHAFIINGNTEDGNRYRMFFKRTNHPKDQSLIIIADRVEDSDNAINSFKVTDKFIADMQKWKGNPFDVMEKRYKELGQPAVGKYLPKDIYFAAEIVYHSVLDFKFLGRWEKGHPEGLIIGASRTGKSQVGKALSTYYQLGNIANCKNATAVGLIGGVDKNSNGTFRISWGEIPRNHRGMLFLDEVSGLPNQVFQQMTDLRSERIANVIKIRKGRAPAKTRLLWVGNPREGDDGESIGLEEYANGVQVCKGLYPKDEDISRFDFIVLVPEPSEYISPLNDDGTLPEEKQLPQELKQLIRWVWSRKPEQVIFDTYVERYIEHVAIDLNKDFGSRVKIVGIEAVKKIARIATSIAACCFSTTPDGETIVVKKEHVDWVKDFLIKCYDNEIFRLKEFVAQERKFSTTNDQINLLVAGMVKKYPMIMRILLEQQEVPHYNLQAAGGIAGDEYRYLTNQLFMEGLVVPTQKGLKSTKRLKLASDALKMKKQVKPVDDSKPKSFSDRINLT